MRSSVVGVAMVALSAMSAATAVAQSAPAATQPVAAARPVMFGPEVSFGLRSSSKLGVGARVVYPGLGQMVKVEGLGAFASFDYFFPGSSITFWEVNANATYTIPRVQAPVAPYVGAGLNFSHVGTPSVSVPGFGTVGGGSSSYVGLNVLAGVRYPAGKVTAFGEVKFELRTGSQLVLTAGALF